MQLHPLLLVNTIALAGKGNVSGRAELVVLLNQNRGTKDVAGSPCAWRLWP